MNPEMLGKELIEQLLYENESSTLDFKEKQYSFYGTEDTVKSELLKDILAFTNAWRRSDAYILIGVREMKGDRSQLLGVDQHLNDNDLQQFVNGKTQRPITFSYSAFDIEGKQIGVIHIPVQNRPLYLIKDFGKLTCNTVYIRRGSATAIATPDEIARMGADGVAEKTVREPNLSVIFRSTDNDKKAYLRVKAIETLDKNAILDQLSSIKIDGEELRLLQRHTQSLNSITERYPNGQSYYPYKVEKVFAFIDQLNKSLELVRSDFENFRKRANLFKRCLLFYKPPWADGLQKNDSDLPRYAITEILNNGTSPAHNVIIYLRANDHLKFYNFEDLKQLNLTPYNKIPDEIQKIFNMARKLDEKQITGAEYIGLNSQVGVGSGPFDYSSLFSLPNVPKSTIRIIDSNLQIKLASMLMHNHKESISDSDIYLCPFLEKGETINIEYECHSSELSIPQKGLFQFEAE